MARTGRDATLSDVARAAGVSVGTVSNVLSGAGSVAPATRARVEKAMSELRFRPNQLAQALARKRTDSVGLLIPDVANPFFAELVRGAEDTLGRMGLVAILGNSQNDA